MSVLYKTDPWGILSDKAATSRTHSKSDFLIGTRIGYGDKCGHPGVFLRLVRAAISYI
jgi:hypothetical protein